MKTTPVIAASIALASAKTIEIQAGPTHAFSPSSTTAEIGDVLEFHYYPKNHSVAQGFYANPCQPAQAGGFFSGYVPSTDGESPTTFSVVVNDTSPIFFYCTQATHCKDGMVGVVNPTQNQTLEDYMKAAKAFNGTSSAPPFVFGGTIHNPAGSGTTTGGTTAETGSPNNTGAGGAATSAVRSHNAGSALQPLVGNLLGGLGVVALGLL